MKRLIMPVQGATGILQSLSRTLSANVSPTHQLRSMVLPPSSTSYSMPQQHLTGSEMPCTDIVL